MNTLSKFKSSKARLGASLALAVGAGALISAMPANAVEPAVAFSPLPVSPFYLPSSLVF